MRSFPRAIASAYGHADWSSATLSSSTLTPGLAEEAERTTVGVLVDELVHLGERDPAHLRDPARLDARVRHGDVRVEPGRRRGDRVDRNLGRRREPVLLAVRPRRAASPWRGDPGWSGPGSTRS